MCYVVQKTKACLQYYDLLMSIDAPNRDTALTSPSVRGMSTLNSSSSSAATYTVEVLFPESPAVGVELGDLIGLISSAEVPVPRASGLVGRVGVRGGEPDGVRGGLGDWILLPIVEMEGMPGRNCRVKWSVRAVCRDAS